MQRTPILNPIKCRGSDLAATGIRLDYIGDTQPPGRAAAACVPATHSAEQRRKRERARESGHNEHTQHSTGQSALRMKQLLALSNR